MAKKAPLKDVFSKLKKELDKANNFVDYFLLCGVKPSYCLKETLYVNYTNAQKSIKIQPEILSKCPPFDKALVSIDEGIISYCCSKPFEIVQASVKPNNEISSFILDNNFFSIEYPQKYITCLRFYESISQYKQLKEALSNPSSILKKQKISFAKAKQIVETTLSQKAASTAKSDNKPKSLKSMDSIQVTKQEPMQIFIPKIICLVSIYPFINQHKEILNVLYKYSLDSFIKIPIERVIMNLIIEVPIPPRGLSQIDYTIIDVQYLLSRSEINTLPSIEFELEQLCLCLNLEQILTIFKHLLFETKIIFFSEDVNKIFNIILAFLNFIYPLKYPFQVASYVPKLNYSIIESISPYILGINQVYKDSFFTDNSLEISEMSILVVDIDNKKVNIKSTETFPDLPKHISSKFEKDVITLEKNWKRKINAKSSASTPEDNNNRESSKSTTSQSTGSTSSSSLIQSNNQTFNHSFCQSFFHFIVNIMKNYEQYLNNGYFSSHENIQNTNINTLFKVEEYVQSFSSSEQAFYSKFVTDSQMFSDFIYKRMIPKDNKEKLEILFLDESISEQKWSIFAKKDNIFFINSKEYAVKPNNNYLVPRVRELSNEDHKMFLNESLRIKMLEYGQIIREYEDGSINFDYKVFPVLNHDIFFNEKTLLDYCLPPSLNDELESINTDLISRSYLSQITVKSFEMENYLYLTWLQLWAFSFHYIDVKEHNQRFNQMMTILEKVTHHEIEIFNLIFEALKNKNEEEMIKYLYQKLISYKLNPSCYIYSIISKLIDKEKIKTLGLINQSPEKLFKTTDYKFRPRTIKTSFENEVLMDRVKFYPNYNCVVCQMTLDIEKLSFDFVAMNRDVMWAFCPKCDMFILPKIQIRVGLELNFNPDCFGQTSTVDEVVVHSPYNLKINIKDGLFREYGINLDIENFKMRFTALFWNSIWYFRLIKLDYSFFLPYSSLITKPEPRKMTNFVIQKKNLSQFKVSLIRNNIKVKKIRYDKNTLIMSKAHSFELCFILMKVLGCTSSILETTSESTFNNIKILDNSSISDVSLVMSMTMSKSSKLNVNEEDHDTSIVKTKSYNYVNESLKGHDSDEIDIDIDNDKHYRRKRYNKIINAIVIPSAPSHKNKKILRKKIRYSFNVIKSKKNIFNQQQQELPNKKHKRNHSATKPIKTLTIA